MLDTLKENEPLSQSRWMTLCREQEIKRTTFEHHLDYLKTSKAVTWTDTSNGKAIMYKKALTIEDIMESINSDSKE